MTPCGSYKNRRFGGSYRLHLHGARVREAQSLCLYKSLQLRSVTSSHSCTLKMEAIRSSETSVLIRATRCHFPEDDNHHSHRRGNLKSYIFLFLYNLFNDAANIPYYIGHRRKWSWPNVTYYLDICLNELGKTTKIKISQDSRSPGRDENPGPLSMKQIAANWTATFVSFFILRHAFNLYKFSILIITHDRNLTDW
jgi:hypothetical protein